MPELKSDRFSTETGQRLLVQVPEADAERVLEAILVADPLTWGDYDQVSFCTALGLQRFRSLPGGVNAPTEKAVAVSCVELQVFTTAQGAELERVVRAIYDVHPYEEPVIQIVDACRTRHIAGADEGNPNRFWNRPDAAWVLAPHRRKQGGQDQKA